MFNGRENAFTSQVIENSGFFGNVDIADFQRSRGIPLQVPVELIESALVYAIQSVERDLLQVSEGYRMAGFQHVEELEGIRVNQRHQFKILFDRAVFARAKHELLPEFETLSAREIHEKRDLVAEQRQLLSEATQAIRALKGKGRGTVSLL